MKRHLFYTLLVIFAVTSAVTLLGVTGIIPIAGGYLTALVSAFLIELAGAVIALFKRAEFFSEDAHSKEIIAEITRRHAAEVLQLKSEHAQEMYRLTNPPKPTVEEIYKKVERRDHDS